jgi:hypothetical protein
MNPAISITLIDQTSLVQEVGSSSRYYISGYTKGILPGNDSGCYESCIKSPCANIFCPMTKKSEETYNILLMHIITYVGGNAFEIQTFPFLQPVILYLLIWM